jgi:hypothetical protein
MFRIVVVVVGVVVGRGFDGRREEAGDRSSHAVLGPM